MALAALVVIPLILFSCGTKPADRTRYRYVDPAVLVSLIKEKGAIVVDTTSYIEWMDHRIPGSRSIPVEEFDRKAPVVLTDKKAPVVLYCESEKCPGATLAYDKAGRLGYQDLYILEDGMVAWKRAGYEVETVERVKRRPLSSVKADRLDGLLKEKRRLFVLDVRSEEAFRAGHVEGAANIPLYLLHKRVGEIPKDLPVIVIDERGKRSFLAGCYLVNHGVRDVTRLFGGMASMAPQGGEKG